jgi:hypothetical protein
MRTDSGASTDKYEFLVYRMLRNRLEAGDIYVSDSLRFRSFDEDLIPQPQWQQHKERILRDADVPALAQPHGANAAGA